MVASLAVVSSASAQSKRPDADDTKAIKDCIKTAASAGKPMSAAEICVGTVSNPCLDDPKTKSTADMNACIDREKVVWDDILNEAYRQLRAKLDDKQKEKLRDVQRAWIASRDKSCAFYWDYYQGTMASPMTASCVNKETARQALFLYGFVYDQR
ncbi:MAG: lysozyme inhibitor LprI family protein [Pseudolabrys sp.]